MNDRSVLLRRAVIGALVLASAPALGQQTTPAEENTRTVETIESWPDADTIRHGSDTASLHLEFIPPFARPAAVYSLGPLVRLAAYEPCGGQQQPLIRYLRQDAAGRVTTDVLLQREARP